MKRSYTLLATAAAAALGTPGHATADLAHHIRSALAPYVEAGDVSGCVLISRPGEGAVSVCRGMASYEHGLPNAPETRFRIASVSKQFTAAAILLLEEQGRLTVEDPVSRHIPDFPRGETITIHHLLTHTSGLGPMESAPGYESAQTLPHDLAQLVALFANEPPLFTPGTSSSYSNAGYVLLALLVERISGEDFGRFLDRNVFLPAGMNDSMVDRGDAVVERLASGYDPRGATGRVLAPRLHPSLLVGAGSVVSTVADLSSWLHSLSTDRVLSDASREKMLTSHSGTYGYGVAIYELGGRHVTAHDGRQSGRLADVSYYPDEDVAVVYLGNMQSGCGDAIRAALGAVAFGEVPAPSVRPLLPARLGVGANAASFEGIYRFFPGLDVEVRFRGGRLLARANKTGWSELVPTGQGDFFNRVTYAGAGFVEPDYAGRTGVMLWKQDGNEFRGERLNGAETRD